MTKAHHITESEGRLCWVTALKAEALPLIEHYRLVKAKGRNLFPTFHSKDQRLWLVISGVGKLLSASATTSLYYAAGEQAGMAWLNVGIAGHRDRELGELRWVNKLEDVSSGTKWYPPRILKTGRRQASALHTVDQPGDYPEGDILVEMEASGFYSIASRFSTRELVQCLKVVSDNAEHSWQEIDKFKVREWVAANMDDIAAGSEELLELSREERLRCAPPLESEQILAGWHFTETEKHLLLKILRRYQILNGEGALLYCQDKGFKSAAQILAALRQVLLQLGDEAVVE